MHAQKLIKCALDVSICDQQNNLKITTQTFVVLFPRDGRGNYMKDDYSELQLNYRIFHQFILCTHIYLSNYIYICIFNGRHGLVELVCAIIPIFPLILMQIQ